MRTNIKGILAASVVPYNKYGEITDKQLEKLYTFLIDGGVNGLFIGGSTGEWPLLTVAERKQIAGKAVQVSDGHLPVIVNISSLLVDEAVEYARHAKAIGATAVSITAPFYFSYDNACLKQYYSAILNEVKLPVYLYNIPSNVKNIITPGLLQDLSDEYENIAGIKDSSMDFMTFLEYSQIKSDELSVFMGNDGQILSALQWGGAGSVAATAAIFPHVVTEIYRCFKAGEMDAAQEVQQKIIKLRAIIRSHSPISVYKAALNLQGVEVGAPRTPLRGLSDSELKTVQGQLEQLELL